MQTTTWAHNSKEEGSGVVTYVLTSFERSNLNCHTDTATAHAVLYNLFQSATPSRGDNFTFCLRTTEHCVSFMHG